MTAFRRLLVDLPYSIVFDPLGDVSGDGILELDGILQRIWTISSMTVANLGVVSTDKIAVYNNCPRSSIG